jgi:hypothetical protein
MMRHPGLRGLCGALLGGVAAVSALIACGARGECTVIGKDEQGVFAHACQTGGTLTGPVAVPVWGSCSAPECWRLIVRDGDGETFRPCVSREEYDRTQPGTFWSERTDRSTQERG